jgi:hypothetical protein
LTQLLRQGYKTAIEKNLPDGRRIDVLAERNGQKIGMSGEAVPIFQASPRNAKICARTATKFRRILLLHETVGQIALPDAELFSWSFHFMLLTRTL